MKYIGYAAKMAGCVVGLAALVGCASHTKEIPIQPSYTNHFNYYSDGTKNVPVGQAIDVCHPYATKTADDKTLKDEETIDDLRELARWQFFTGILGAFAEHKEANQQGSAGFDSLEYANKLEARLGLNSLNDWREAMRYCMKHNGYNFIKPSDAPQ